MPRLKTSQTSLGFYDLAIAAPLMKAYGAGSNLFHQGVAKETEDAESSPRRWRSPASCSGALLDRTAASPSIPTCRPLSAAAKGPLGASESGRSRRSERLPESATRKPARPRRREYEAKASAIEAERAALDERAAAEERRREK